MLRKYLYTTLDEDQRNILQHTVLKPVIQQSWPHLLQDYGLGEKLAQAQALKTGSKVLFLEGRSGSGSLLEDLAAFLSQKELLAGAELIGLDPKLEYVERAEQRRHDLPGGSAIKYYLGDVTQPLEHNYSLMVENKFHFDCIFLTVLLQYMPQARQHLLRLYDSLKPGGVLYLCDSYMAYEGAHPWVAPNPGIEKFGRIATKMVRDLNDGQIVAEQSANWLREAGAQQVTTTLQLVSASTKNEAELTALRYYIAIIQSVTPLLIASGLVDAAEQVAIQQGFHQINQHSQAQLPFIHTMARKPL